MNLFRALIELDEAYNDRQALIDEIKKSGKNYNFDINILMHSFTEWRKELDNQR